MRSSDLLTSWGVNVSFSRSARRGLITSNMGRSSMSARRISGSAQASCKSRVCSLSWTKTSRMRLIRSKSRVALGVPHCLSASSSNLSMNPSKENCPAPAAPRSADAPVVAAPCRSRVVSAILLKIPVFLFPSTTVGNNVHTARRNTAVDESWKRAMFERCVWPGGDRDTPVWRLR